MNRRLFISLSAIGGVSTLISADNIIEERKDRLPKDIYLTLEAIISHFFPSIGHLPSAQEFGAMEFLDSTIYHRTFDRDIRDFIIRGAESFIRESRGAFLKYNQIERERVLREFESSSIGGDWLSRIMILSMEALLSDPIYGGNIRESGWRALDIDEGKPQPSVRFVEL